MNLKLWAAMRSFTNKAKLTRAISRWLHRIYLYNSRPISTYLLYVFISPSQKLHFFLRESTLETSMVGGCWWSRLGGQNGRLPQVDGFPWPDTYPPQAMAWRQFGRVLWRGAARDVGNCGGSRVAFGVRGGTPGDTLRGVSRGHLWNHLGFL